MEYSEAQQRYIEVSVELEELAQEALVERAKAPNLSVSARKEQIRAPYYLEAIEKGMRTNADKKAYALAKASEDSAYQALNERPAPPATNKLALRRAQLEAEKEILTLQLAQPLG